MSRDIRLNSSEQNNVITVTNNNVKYYQKVVEQYVQQANTFAVKAANYANQAMEYLNACQALKGSIDEETMQLVSLHSENKENPHEVTSEQVGAYSKEKIDELFEGKQDTLIAGSGINIIDNQDGSKTINSTVSEFDFDCDYEGLTNLPSINSVSLVGDKTSEQLGLVSADDIPTKLSDLENDCGYLIQHQDISGKQDVISDLEVIRSGSALGLTSLQAHQDISGKQDVLESGTGISIDNNVISVVDCLNVDMSNLSNDGKKVVDGQWIEKKVQIFNSTAINTYTVDLSEYLPDDEYTYEIVFSGRAYQSNSTYTILEYKTDVMTDFRPILHVGANNRDETFNIVAPVGTGRRIIFKISGRAVESWQVPTAAYMYRRIGTNTDEVSSDNNENGHGPGWYPDEGDDIELPF